MQQLDNAQELPPPRIIRRRRNSMDFLYVGNIIDSRLRNRPARADQMASMVLLAAIEPMSFDEAMASKDHKQWEQAMQDEIESLVERKPNQKVIDNK